MISRYIARYYNNTCFFSVLSVLPIGEVEKILDNAQNVLDDLWRYDPHYPTERMRYLLDAIGIIILITIIVCHIGYCSANYNTEFEKPYRYFCLINANNILRI